MSRLVVNGAKASGSGLAGSEPREISAHCGVPAISAVFFAAGCSFLMEVAEYRVSSDCVATPARHLSGSRNRYLLKFSPVIV